MASDTQGPTLRSHTRRSRPQSQTRTFELSPPSAESSAPSSPYPELNNTSTSTGVQSLDIPESSNEKDSSKEKGASEGKEKDDGLSSRSRSFRNLTASTLFGIYSPNALDGGSGVSLNSSRDELGGLNLGMTPVGTGAQTPSKRTTTSTGSVQYTTTTSPSPSRRRRAKKAGVGNLLLRSVLLFGFGVAYGVIVTHLHDSPRLAPVRIQGIDHESWRYGVFWGLAGIGLGSLLPWFDTVWEDWDGYGGSGKGGGERKGQGQGQRRTGMADWYAVVRSVGAFVGIAFAIRKLPWQSTLQVSLTLALVNPVLWYLIDRSKPGFMLSTVVGIAGMFVMLNVNPQIVPAPATTAASATSMMAGNETGSESSSASAAGITHETIAVGTWIASVLFCSCVCFGNIGRRLALGGEGR